MDQHDPKRHKRKIITITEERTESGKNKTFFTRMLVPEYLKYFFADSGGLVVPDLTFPKKKESENYAYLLAVKRLYAFGLFGEDLYPNINRYLNQKLLNIGDNPELLNLDIDEQRRRLAAIANTQK